MGKCSPDKFNQEQVMQSDQEESTAALAAVLSPKSAWSVARMMEFLHTAHLPLRVATVNADGFPHITSLWFRYAADRLLCCTQQSAVIARHLRHNAQVGFELAVNQPPYHGLSGHGAAAIVSKDSTALLNQLAEHYLEGRDSDLRKWLLSRVATEVIIEITPLRITSWDFRRRMTSAE
jgi:nitroimidazol reductase NimA-like FMN-containing flavoprotein (pyridoxamine 5'-phosphate oxidase superfamily)